MRGDLHRLRWGVLLSQQSATHWSLLRSRLLARISKTSYDTWFNRLQILGWEQGCLHLEAPNRYVKHWIETHYLRDLLDAARTVEPATTSVMLSVAVAVSAPEVRTESVGKVLHESSVALGLVDRHAPKPYADTQRSGLFRLDALVIGNANRLAYAAAQTVVEAPASVYNPLVIHGDHGLGKTHVLHGLAHALQQKHPHFRIRHVSCEEFANTYLQALQVRKLDAFRADFRSCHALIVDDVQFLSNKEKTQDEFLHTFDALRNLGRQVILSSIVHPREIKHLDVRLAERFQSGLVARVAPPDFAMRSEVLQRKAKTRGLTLSTAVSEILSSRVERSFCELEGVVCKLGALSAAEGRAPDRELALLALRELGYLHEGPLSLEEILEAVVQRTRQNADEIRSSKRHADLVRTRHIAMYLSKTLAHCNLGEIGRYYGNRDHSTVLHAARKIAAVMKHDEALRDEVQALQRILGR